MFGLGKQNTLRDKLTTPIMSGNILSYFRDPRARATGSSVEHFECS